jgi:hypothetical protein
MMSHFGVHAEAGAAPAEEGSTGAIFAWAGFGAATAALLGFALFGSVVVVLLGAVAGTVGGAILGARPLESA